MKRGLQPSAKEQRAIEQRERISRAVANLYQYEYDAAQDIQAELLIARLNYLYTAMRNVTGLDFQTKRAQFFGVAHRAVDRNLIAEDDPRLIDFPF